jgi:4'-phosphopantetheinyl transferase
MDERPALLDARRVWAAQDRFIASLAPEEHDRFEGFKLEKRRRDFLAGRIAAKRAVQKRLGLPFSRIAILSDDQGAPRIVIGGEAIPSLFVSITHADDLAAAAVGTHPIGIDIELVEHRDDSFVDLVFTPAERLALDRFDDRARVVEITVRWCMKEAISKWLGVGLGEPFSRLDTLAPRVPFSDQGCFSFGGKELCWARAWGPRAEAK